MAGLGKGDRKSALPIAHYLCGTRVGSRTRGGARAISGDRRCGPHIAYAFQRLVIEE